MQHRNSWEAKTPQLFKKFLAIYGTRRYSSVHSTQNLVPIHNPTYPVHAPICPVSWRFVLILSYHLRLVIPSDVFPSGFLPEPCTHRPSPTYALHSTSIYIPVQACTWIIMFLHYALQPYAYCVIWVRRSNFRHQASPRVSPRESTQRWKLELWATNVR
jgi:hypothetical protein